MKMPEMTGEELLREVSKRYPETIRIVLSAFSEDELVMGAINEAIASGDQTAANEAFKSAQPEIMRAASKGVLHANTASRKVSRLNARIKALGA